MNEWKGPDGYWVSDDPDRIDRAWVHQWLSAESYWATGRTPQATDKAISNSLNLALFDAGGRQVGYCRWVTDGATFAWLCDVFVEAGHRGRGLGVLLVGTAMEHPEVHGLRMFLGTKDAHALYRRFGFSPLRAPERMMEVWPGGPPP